MRLSTDIIADKRDGKRLSGDDIRGFLKSYLGGSVPDYQASALLMAVLLNGLDREELAAWTDAMLRSGEILDWKDLDRPVLDKHSTGGVGDKISIPLAPALAALGCVVPMISGRGLGHTGGTLDKLESIPGFNVRLSLDRFRDQVKRLGCALIGQTPEISPLDRRLYALRDVTGTVESIPLIASSIMSKKLAEGIGSLVLDVKTGRGAFMKTERDAGILARTMKHIGESFGVRVSAVLTRMDEPLGWAVGNALEIAESVEVLRGRHIPEISELVEKQGGILLALAGLARNARDGREKIRSVLENGMAMEKFLEVVRAQGGDVSAIEKPEKLVRSKFEREIRADRDGYVAGLDALAFGKALVALGGGRERMDDAIDPAVGFLFRVKSGQQVRKGDILYTVRYNDESRLARAEQYCAGAVLIRWNRHSGKRIILGVV